MKDQKGNVQAENKVAMYGTNERRTRTSFMSSKIQVAELIEKKAKFVTENVENDELTRLNNDVQLANTICRSETINKKDI